VLPSAPINLNYEKVNLTSSESFEVTDVKFMKILNEGKEKKRKPD
jgi:hypothetical protein